MLTPADCDCLEMGSVILRATTESYTNIYIKNSIDKSKRNCKQCLSNPQKGRKNKTVKCKQRDKVENTT